MNGNDAIYPMATEGDGFNDGLTKRELIAAMAMQGLLSNSSVIRSSLSYSELFETLSEMSVKSADALIERLAADPVAEGVNLLPMYSRELDEGLTDETN
jgi:hypothetical protein